MPHNSQDKSPMDRFEDALVKIVKVGKKELDEALEAEKHLAEKVEETIERPSDAEPG
jgi:hypothetical protein